jgi:hypothetical protein
MKKAIPKNFMQFSPWAKEAQTLAFMQFSPWAKEPPNTKLMERISKWTFHDLNPLPKFK